MHKSIYIGNFGLYLTVYNVDEEEKIVTNLDKRKNTSMYGHFL